jgi:hypothetical protein
MQLHQHTAAAAVPPDKLGATVSVRRLLVAGQNLKFFDCFLCWAGPHQARQAAGTFITARASARAPMHAKT